MDDSYKNKVVLLQKIVRDGIAKLLTEAKANSFLEPPYGRLPFPTPLITEDEFIKSGALGGDDVEPEFNFEYGFDPLKVLAEFIMWSHPNSVEGRRQKKIEAAKFLELRAEHARRQMHVSNSLGALAHYESSGILWGPLCSPSSSRSVVVVCKSLKKGKVICQISKFRDFREILEKKEVTVGLQGDAEEPRLTDILPVKVVFKDLKPATKHFIRACLSSNPVVKAITPKKLNDMSTKVEPEEDTEEECADLLFKGLHGGAFSYTEFWTLPSADRSAQEAIELEEPSTASSEHHGNHGHHRHHHHHHHHHHKKSEIVTEANDADTYPPVLINCFGQLPVTSYVNTLAPPEAPSPRPVDAPASRVDPYCPSVTCLLGDVLAAGTGSNCADGGSDRTTSQEGDELLRNLSSLLARCPLFAGLQAQPPLHASSFLLAWRDGSEGSNYSLRAEELAYKQFRSEVKRHKKKYAKTKSTGASSSNVAALHMPPLPTIARLPFTDALQSLLQGLPIDADMFADPLAEAPAAPANAKGKPNPAAQAAAAAAAAQTAAENVKATRMMYRTQMMGPDVLLIVLDMRGQGTAGDYLGKEQAAWLDLVLQESATIQWKIVLCGKTFGLIHVPAEENAAAAARDESQREGGGVTGEGELVEGVAGISLGVDGEPNAGHTNSEGPSLDMISEEHEMEVSAPSKSVQLPSAGDRTRAAITAAMTEDVEDTYGRSACSLHHILAAHQVRTNQGPSAYNRANAADNRVMTLTSGIVLLTSGMASTCPSLVVTAAAHHHHSLQQDTASPAYVAGYTNLTAHSISRTGAWENQVLPDRDNAVARIPSQLFCAEVSLGRADLTCGDLARDPKSATFFFRDGFEAHTVYSAVQRADQADAGANESAPSPLSATTCCSLFLMPNGQLSVKLYRADSALRDGTCRDPAPLVECVLEAPVPEDDEDDDLEEEQ
jgi:hypothetical protein